MGKQNKLRVLKYIFSNAIPFKKFLLLHLIVVIYGAIDTSLWPYISKILIDIVAASEKDQVWENSKYFILLFIFLTILPGLVWRLTDYSWSCLTPLMRQKIIVDASSSMLRKSNDFFCSNPAGSLANRIKDLSQSTTALLNTILYSFLSILLSLAVAFYTLWHVHKVFALGLIFWAGIFIYMAIRALELTAKMSADVTASQAKAFGNIVDVFSNIQNVKFFTNEDEEIRRISSNQKSYSGFFKIRGFFLIKFYTLHGLTFSAYFACAIFTLIYYYSKGVLSLGDFILIFAINSWMINSMWRIAGQLQIFSGEFGAVDQSLRILGRPLAVKDKKDAADLKIESKIGPEIIFRNVEFSYQKHRSDPEPEEISPDLFPAKSDLSIKTELKIAKGQKVGLVGSSGSGKSTFINLLMRSYDVNSGQILVNNKDIKNVTQKSLRQNISLVPQEPILFHRSILANIKYAKLDASQEEVEAAAKSAYCHKFVTRLKRGYDTVVGDRGSKISGGQKQRLAIARAFLEDSKILIIDEGTSGLDNTTEQLVHRSLLKLMADKTVIIAAHKLVTLQELDRILVFNRGRIVEDGSHEELIRIKDGHYSKMWQHQSIDFVDPI